MTTIHVEIAPPYVEQVVAYLQALPADQRGKITVETEPNDKLTHEQLMALPENEMLDYCKKHGGVLAVMGENGYALTQEQVDDWHKMKEAEDKEWEVEYKRRYGKDLPR